MAMPLRPPERPRLSYIGGRNFIESIVYTLTYLEYQNRLATGVENFSFLVTELERQLCGLARAVPQLKVIYHDYVTSTLREMFQDYPIPSLGPACPVRGLLIEWFTKNKNKLFKNLVGIAPAEAVARKITSTVDTILHQAILGTLYKAGILSHG